MKNSVIRVHPDDNVIVALQDLTKGAEVVCNNEYYTIVEDIPGKA